MRKERSLASSACMCNTCRNYVSSNSSPSAVSTAVHGDVLWRKDVYFETLLPRDRTGICNRRYRHVTVKISSIFPLCLFEPSKQQCEDPIEGKSNLCIRSTISNSWNRGRTYAFDHKIIPDRVPFQSLSDRPSHTQPIIFFIPHEKKILPNRKQCKIQTPKSQHSRSTKRNQRPCRSAIPQI